MQESTLIQRQTSIQRVGKTRIHWMKRIVSRCLVSVSRGVSFSCVESFIDDRAFEHGQAPASSDPLQDEASWDILEEYLTSEMSFPQLEAKLLSHLGSRYHEVDWAEAKHTLFSANEDNVQALANLRAVKAWHILPAKVASPLRGTFDPGSTR
jgi:hypothetical protein